jgi:outer membrane murein-binding lipoprotein Lpp
MVLSALVVGGLVLGLTTLNAMVAQSSFKVDDLTERVQRLQRDAERKRFDIAELRAPDRVVSAAEELGLVLPKPNAVEVIHVRGAVKGRGTSDLAPPGDGG